MSINLWRSRTLTLSIMLCEIMFKIFRILSLVIVVWSYLSYARDCNLADELPCLTSEDCIGKTQWCDKKFDCKDGSDEYFCNVDSCPVEHYFHCGNRKCITDLARCDGFDDCGDGSDEICEGANGYTNHSSLGMHILEESLFLYSENTTDEVARAAKYLLRKRQLDNDWYNFEPRAVVALAFAERAGRIPDRWISPLKKELNLKILLNLMQNGIKPNMCDLAHYINALYATCQDPRNFQGIDLVKLLRSEVDNATKLELPFVLLSLCIAKEVNNEDTERLLAMYDNIGSDRMSLKALILMAFACISKTTKGVSRNTEVKIQQFGREARSLVGSTDIYTKALYLQALYAFGYDIEIDLPSYQLSDGSFGDLLSTYYAIPALLKKSLLDLKCKASKYEAFQMGVRLPGYDSDLKEVTYSLWIDKGKYINTHSMVITLEGNKTFYDVMKLAEAKSSIFSFLYDSSSEGKNIYSLAGIPNDAETAMSWTLYQGNGRNVRVNFKDSLSKQTLGVDQVFPRAGEHFVFWFERSLD